MQIILSILTIIRQWWNASMVTLNVILGACYTGQYLPSESWDQLEAVTKRTPMPILSHLKSHDCWHIFPKCYCLPTYKKERNTFCTSHIQHSSFYYVARYVFIQRNGKGMTMMINFNKFKQGMCIFYQKQFWFDIKCFKGSKTQL